MMGGVNLIKIHCRLICKCHNEFPPQQKKKKQYKKKKQLFFPAYWKKNSILEKPYSGFGLKTS
jgi:hypothetical protein